MSRLTRQGQGHSLALTAAHSGPPVFWPPALNQGYLPASQIEGLAGRSQSSGVWYSHGYNVLTAKSMKTGPAKEETHMARCGRARVRGPCPPPSIMTGTAACTDYTSQGLTQASLSFRCRWVNRWSCDSYSIPSPQAPQRSGCCHLAPSPKLPIPWELSLQSPPSPGSSCLHTPARDQP